MSLKDDSFPSSSSFDLIQNALTTSPTAQKDAIKSANAIFAFKLTNSANATQTWHIDLKNSGTVARGDAPPGKKADVTLVLSDEDFGKMVAGKAKAQSLFMSGKLKVRGNVMKATKLEPVLAKAQQGQEGGKAKL